MTREGLICPVGLWTLKSTPPPLAVMFYLFFFTLESQVVVSGSSHESRVGFLLTVAVWRAFLSWEPVSDGLLITS